MYRGLFYALVLAAIPLPVMAQQPVKAVERWDVFEIALPGPAEGNPFVDVTLAACFSHENLVYFGREQPTHWAFELPPAKLVDGMKFRVEILDTWNMTVTPVEKSYLVRKVGGYAFRSMTEKQVDLPGRPYLALRIRKVEG